MTWCAGSAARRPRAPRPHRGRVRAYAAGIDTRAALLAPDAVAAVRATADLARLLRELRRRHARRRGGTELTYRDLAAATGWSHGIIGGYLSGRVLPPTDRFDVLVRLLGASPAEQGALATARDRVEEGRRPVTSPAPAGPERPVPRQLPADVPAFTGRAPHLAGLDAVLAGAGPRVALIAGTAGVGKTALAVHWAHRVAGRFPDGQLYVDLRGHDPRQPVDPGDALAAFLRGLGVPASGIPATTDERAARFRTEVAGRRLLVVLDNAAGAGQVRPLLPGTSTGAVVVTSRDTLGGLVARDGVHPVRLGRLDRADSRTLLRRLLGPGAGPGTVDLLADRCAGLPLALRIAAARPSPHCSGDPAGLAAFDAGGDPHTALRSVFSWSLRRLDPSAARAFQLLGLHPGRVVDTPAATALAGVPAGALLDELARAHLVEPADGGCTMHDLLRAYSVELAARLPHDEAGAALDRLTAHLLHTATAAAATLFPHDHAGSASITGPVTGSTVDGPEAATRWLDRHRAALVTLAGSRAAVPLSRVLWRYLEVGGHYREALALHTAAAAHGDAGAHTNLGAVHWLLGDHDLAKVHFGRSLGGHRAAGDAAGEARATARLALVHERLGDHDEALTRLRDALAAYRALGDRHGEGAQLLNLGFTLHRAGRHREALDHLHRAAALFADLGDRRLEGYALGNLGAVFSATGRHDAALAHLHVALERCVAAGDRGGEGTARSTLGVAYHRRGDHTKALGHLRHALTAARATGECGLEIETLNALGDVLLAMGRPDAAGHRFAAARALAERAGDRHGLALAVDGLSRACR
ncbi:ATP-binding protein [Dactylosporangium sp. NPDC000521]|uniref:ATP-binding protein n=1 Tax=Dactylosporangium sp. NPDC000521 TaxID=3363975 RepID=UPI003690A02E